jgi:hypothetical protein
MIRVRLGLCAALNNGRKEKDYAAIYRNSEEGKPVFTEIFKQTVWAVMTLS